MHKPKLLFVCSQNRWRSLTADIIFKKDHRFEARSAGTSRGAKHVISQKDIQWADKIICMENRHKELIEHIFKNQHLPPIIIWDIENHLKYMDPELIDILRDRIEEVI